MLVDVVISALDFTKLRACCLQVTVASAAGLPAASRLPQAGGATAPINFTATATAMGQNFSRARAHLFVALPQRSPALTPPSTPQPQQANTAQQTPAIAQQSSTPQPLTSAATGTLKAPSLSTLEAGTPTLIPSANMANPGSSNMQMPFINWPNIQAPSTNIGMIPQLSISTALPGTATSDSSQGQSGTNAPTAPVNMSNSGAPAEDHGGDQAPQLPAGSSKRPTLIIELNNHHVQFAPQ